jgi:isocitrate dehydrogenase (NAD+)
MSAKIPATLIPGDGIGPEITEAVTRILDALGSPFEWPASRAPAIRCRAL